MSADNVTRREVLVAQVLDHYRFVFAPEQVEAIVQALTSSGRLFNDSAIVAEAMRLGLARLEGWQPMLPTERDLRRAAGLWLARLARPILEHEEHFEEFTRRVMGLALQEPPAPEDELVVPTREEAFDLAAFRTVGDFLAMPDGSCGPEELEALEDEGLGIGRMQELATILAERRLLAVLRRVLDIYRPLMPEELAAVVPPATSDTTSPEQEAIDEFLWEHVNCEVASEVDFVERWMTRLALLPFADTLLKYRPDAGKQLAVHQALRESRDERYRRLRAKMASELERLAKLFPKTPLSRDQVPSFIREVIVPAVTAEGLMLVCQLLEDKRLHAMLEDDALHEFRLRLTPWLERLETASLDFSACVVSLVRALDEARARDGREWFVSLYANGLHLFCEENWHEFLLFALSYDQDVPYAVTVRRIEREHSPADPNKPIVTVAGMMIDRRSVTLFPAEAVRSAAQTDAQTGKALPADDNVRYTTMRELVPDFLFLIETLPDKTRTVH